MKLKKKMSGPLRQIITPTSTRLSTYLTEAENLPENRNMSQVKRLLNKINRSVNFLDCKNFEWSEIMSSMTGEARTLEMQEYNNFLATNNFIDLIDRGKVQAVELENWIEENLPTTNGTKIRLPQLSLPTFDGKMANWEQFWSAFQAAIDDDLSIPDVQKMAYLISCLKGDAERELKGYNVIGTNYTHAVKHLKNRFGNKESIKSALFGDLRKISFASQKTPDIRKMLTEINRILNQLKASGEEINNKATEELIQQKFPGWILLDIITQKKGIAEFNTEKLIILIDEILTQRETVWELTKNFKNTKFQKNEQTLIGENSESKNQKIQNTDGKSRLPCVFCSGTNHTSNRCLKYKNKDMRIKRLFELKKCMKCFKEGHISKNCTQKIECKKCKGPHFVAVCAKINHEEINKMGNSSGGKQNFTQSKDKESWRKGTANCAEEENNPEQNDENTQESLFLEDEAFIVDDEVILSEGKNKVVLMSNTHEFKNGMYGNGEEGTTLYDPGSTSNYITNSLARKLKLTILKRENTRVSGYGGSQSSFQSGIVKVYVKGVDENYYPLLCKTSPALEKMLITVTYVTDERIPRVKTRKVKPDLMLGVIDFWRVFERKKRISQRTYRIFTKLGAFDCGEMKIDKPITSYAYVMEDEYEIGGKNPKDISYPGNFWDLEILGIKENPNTTRIDEEDEAMKQFENNLRQLNDGRYEVAWPWKNGIPKLSSNFGKTYGRFINLYEKHGTKIMEKCEQIINEQLSLGMVEDAPFETGELCHYIPFQVILKESSSFTKARMVFDPSARTREGLSLNQQLLTGPNLLPKLAGVLLRIRTYSLLLICDIEKAFLQIALREADRDATRFLWVFDINKPPKGNNLRILRFSRVPFGFVSSPFLLIATVIHHLRKFDTPLTRELIKNLYMDNMASKANTVEEAIENYHKIKDIFSKAKMNVREFISNSKEVNDNIPEKDQHPGIKGGLIKLLGVHWSPNEDTLLIKLPTIPKAEIISKRNLLAYIHSVFDPHGLLSPVTVSAKLLYQKVCNRKVKWEDKLNEEEMQNWDKISKTWDNCHYSFPRNIDYGGKKDLHCFVDASMNCYAAVIYLRSQIDSDFIKSHLIFSKNRIKPLDKNLTIPRLELLTAVIGFRAVKFVQQELKLDIENITIWSDSQIALYWIGTPYNDKKFENNKFVKNRLMEIQADKNIIFRYVPTKQNPADISCRGCETMELRTNSLWWFGPKWLKQDYSYWPAIIQIEPKEETNEEEDIQIHQNGEEDSFITELNFENSTIDPSRFSSFWRLLYTLMFVLRFCKMVVWRKCSKLPSEIERLNKITAGETNILVKRNDEFKIEKPFTASDIEIAEKILIKEAQNRHPLTDQRKKELQIYEDEFGILRCRSRLQNNTYSFDFTNPIYLPHNDPFTKLLILKIHRLLLHGSASLVHSSLKNRFYLERARSTIKKTLKECKGNCREFRKYQLEKMPPYPNYRLEKATVFEYTGLDFMGPINMKRNGELIKGWILLLTCLVSRCVHLEIVTDMTTTSFLKAFRMFVARRTKPKIIVSDNGAQFRLGKKVLDLLWKNLPNDEGVTTYMANEGINWKFNTPLAPWQGGIFERINGLIKNCCRKALGGKILQEDDFRVFICEVEAVLNCRPIIPVTDDLDSFVLRPIDFIYPGAMPGLPNHNNPEDDDTYLPKNAESAEKLLEIWNKKSTTINKFWDIWAVEYLNILRERTQFHRQNNKNLIKALPKVNEIVMIQEDDMVKGTWKIGKIVEVISPRRIAVKLPNGNIVHRPPSLLYSLEIPREADIQAYEEADIEISEEANIATRKIKLRGKNVQKTRNNHSNSKKLKYVNNPRKNCLTCGKTHLKKLKKFNPFVICLISICFIISNVFGQNPMLCPSTDSSQYWRIEDDMLPCANFTIDPPLPTVHTFDVYEPNLDLVSLEAAHCSIIEEIVHYKTDLVNIPHSHYEYKNKSVTQEECNRMWKLNRCSEGILMGEYNNKRTQNQPEVDFTYWQIGYKNASITNCFYMKSLIYVKPGSKILSSPLSEIGHCKYPLGTCTLEDESILIWEINNEDKRLCKLKNIAKWTGTFMGDIWIADNKNFALTFDKNPREINDCSNKFVMTNQDYAVPKNQFELMKMKIRRRVKRSNNEPQDGIVRGSQLAAELTANQVLSTNTTRRAFNHIASLICSKGGNEIIGKTFGGMDPTTLARIALNNTFLIGKWISENILETTHCLPIPIKNISFVASEKCYNRLKVNATILDKNIEATIDPKTLILTEKYEEVDCENNKLISLVMGEKLIRVNQLTGKYVEIEEKRIHQLKLGTKDSNNKLELEPTVFYNYIITNYTDPRQKTMEMFQAYRLDQRFEEKKLESELKIGRWNEYMHESKEKLNHLFPSWTGFDLNYNWKEIWICISCLYSTYLIVMIEMIPMIMTRILRYTNIDQYLDNILPNIGVDDHPTYELNILPSGVNTQNQQRQNRRIRRNYIFTRRARSVA